MPFRRLTASLASSDVAISTKPKPRDRPVSRSVTTLAAELAEGYGLLEPRGYFGYTRYGFGLFAIVFGVWQFRLARAGAVRQASRVFVWSQIGWLLLVLAEHGALG